MTGFNMPPGCSPSDISGNSKADQDAEAFYETLYEQCPEMSDEAFEKLAAWVWERLNKVYADAYAQGQSDEAEARMHNENQNEGIE